VRKITAILDKAGIDYMLTGSLVSSLQGEPRSTHDIDFIVEIDLSNVSKFNSAFSIPDFYFDDHSIIDAVRRNEMFNIIDSMEGFKIDFWILTNTPFDRSRFSRRYNEDIGGISVFVSSPEDTILMKLYWAKLSGGSEKQVGDALSVFEVRAAELDLMYIDYWACELRIEDLWSKLKKEAHGSD